MAALDEFIASFSKFGGHALANRFEENRDKNWNKINTFK